MNINTLTDRLIDIAIAEDLGDGDHSALACIPADKRGSAQLLVKQSGVLAGVEIAKQVFAKIADDFELEIFLQDGARISPGDVAFKVSGRVIPLLQAERLVLNFMQRMSGIASQTVRYADIIADLPTKILDTRKTTPGLRLIEKMAVKIGGGENHRMGLYDMVMLKDNHNDFAGGIPQAVERVKKYLAKKNKNLKIEVEVRNFQELQQVLNIEGVDRVMLDNFSVEDTREAVKRVAGKMETESSGGITLVTLRAYAECGVDYISVGALTHQIQSLDLSLKAFF